MMNLHIPKDQCVAIVQFGDSSCRQHVLVRENLQAELRALGREMTRIDATNNYRGIAGLVLVVGRCTNVYNGDEAVEVMFG